MRKPRRRSPSPPPDIDQQPLPMPDPEEAARPTRELLDRLKRNREPARPTPWLLPIEMPPASRQGKRC
jgi:hypothetical protein